MYSYVYGQIEIHNGHHYNEFLGIEKYCISVNLNLLVMGIDNKFIIKEIYKKSIEARIGALCRKSVTGFLLKYINQTWIKEYIHQGLKWS